MHAAIAAILLKFLEHSAPPVLCTCAGYMNMEGFIDLRPVMVMRGMEGPIKGRCAPVQILICQNLRNNLQHPNEYLRGATLRFLCRIHEEEILEPLTPSILQVTRFESGNVSFVQGCWGVSAMPTLCLVTVAPDTSDLSTVWAAC